MLRNWNVKGMISKGWLHILSCQVKGLPYHCHSRKLNSTKLVSPASSLAVVMIAEETVGSMFRTHIHTRLATQCWAIALTTELLLGVPCFSWSALKYFHLSCMIYAYWRRFGREAVGNHNLLEWLWLKMVFIVEGSPVECMVFTDTGSCTYLGCCSASLIIQN